MIKLHIKACLDDDCIIFPSITFHWENAVLGQFKESHDFWMIYEISDHGGQQHATVQSRQSLSTSLLIGNFLDTSKSLWWFLVDF